MSLPILSVGRGNLNKKGIQSKILASNHDAQTHQPDQTQPIEFDSTSLSNNMGKRDFVVDTSQISLKNQKHRQKSLLPTLSSKNQNKSQKQSNKTENRPVKRTMSTHSKYSYADSPSSHCLENTASSATFSSNLYEDTVISEALSCQVKELPDMSPLQTGDVNISISLKDYRSEKFDTAIQRLDKAIEQNVSSFFPRFVRGLCHYHLKQFDLALHDFTVCSSFHDRKKKNKRSTINNKKAKNIMESLTNQGRGSKCDIYNNRFGQSLSIFNRGVVRVRMNRIREALEDYDEAISLNNLDCDFYKNRALLHRRMGNFESAQQDYQTIRRIKQANDNVKSENSFHADESGIDQRSNYCNRVSRKISLLSPVVNVVISGKDKDGNKTSLSNTARGNDLRRPTILPNTKPPYLKSTHNHNSSRRQNRGNTVTIPLGSPFNNKNSKLSHGHHPTSQIGRQSSTIAIRKRPRSDFHQLKSSVFGQLHTALTTAAKDRTPDQLQILVDESKMMTAFSRLDRTQSYTLWKYLEYQKYPSNVRIVEQGDPAEDYFLVWTGRVSARVRKDKNTLSVWFSNHHRQNQNASIISHDDSSNRLNIAKALALEQEFTVNIMTAGETLGEAVMDERGKRRASCVTEEPTELLILRKKYFDQTFQKFLLTAYEEKVKKLSTFACFSHWDEKKLSTLASVCREQKFNAGETIVQQNSAATSLYFVKSGLISLVRRLHQDEDKFCDVCVAKLCAGDIFGEASVIVKNHRFTEGNLSKRNSSGHEYRRRIENNFLNGDDINSECSSFYKDYNQEFHHGLSSLKGGSDTSTLMMTQQNPSSVVCDTLAICYHLDKVQINLEDWDKETLSKLSTMAVSYPKDEILYKAHLDQIKFQKQSKVLVNQLVQRPHRDKL